ncbi:glycosyltransferase involved in cell wall biosynthesis [Paenibacillus sp. PvP094]|uniref:glycosyltransferase n=1 Tax=Paenibacillus sp. PvP094 TaxID=3156394 RepID=UPI003391EEF8
MKASVAICTHNRAKDTVEAVQSVLAQESCSFEFEVLVIDNNSRDNTKELFHESLWPTQVRYIMESQLGLSYARNRAIREAKGEFILFLDDDALASSCWIQEVINVFERDAAIGCVGGKIDPIWEGGKPDWIPEEIIGLYTLMDFSDHIVEMKPPYFPFGANVSFRKSVFDNIEPFREDLGRVGNNLLSSEESELISRIREKYKIYYTPYGSVQHKISKSRLNKRWLLRRMYWQGISDATRYNKSSWGLFKHVARIAQAGLLILLCMNNVQKVMSQLVKISYRNGTIVGSFRNGRGLNA